MSFRRIPFQFSTTDPVERQRELEKRFGLPTRDKMHVDIANPLSMSGLKDSNASSSSPRLQHRVPIFMEGYDQPIRSSVDSTSSASDSKKSNVRVIPIEIEGAESRPSARHRTFSGPAGLVKGQNEELLPQKDSSSPLKRSMQDLTKSTKLKPTTGPKVYNIPINVEEADTFGKCPKKSGKADFMEKDYPKVNIFDACKHANDVKSSNEEQKADPEIGEKQEIEININNSLKKIENVLEELKSYESKVQKFSGTLKDKQYRYLDEMLTRCMLRLDDIDTMGNDKVRSSRKNAVKKVQVCIDILENKVNAANSSVAENVVQDKMDNIQEVQHNKIADNKRAGGVEVNNVEMEGKQDVETAVSDDKFVVSTEMTRCTLSQDDSPKNLSMTKSLEEKDENNIGMSEELFEVEMSQDTVSSHGMNAAKPTEVKVPQNAATHGSDVEMKEIQNILNDAKETNLNSDFSQLDDKSINGNMEETTIAGAAGNEVTSFAGEQSISQSNS